MCHFANGSDNTIANEPTSWIWIVEYVAHVRLNMPLVPFVYTAFFTTVFVPLSTVDIDFVAIKHTNENIFMLAEKFFK
jgi:hypothetical protein